MYIAPFPLPVRQGDHDGVACLSKVTCGMHSWRRVAASDVAACQTEPEGHPVTLSGSLAFLAACAAGLYLIIRSFRVNAFIQSCSLLPLPSNVLRAPKACKQNPLVRLEIIAIAVPYLIERCCKASSSRDLLVDGPFVCVLWEFGHESRVQGIL